MLEALSTPRNRIRTLILLAVCGVLHNVFEVIAGRSGGSGLFYGLLSGASVVSFLVAILVCPIGVLVGAIGAFVTSIRNRRPPAPGTTTVA